MRDVTQTAYEPGPRIDF